MLRVLVTGASGFIGSHVCDALVDSHHDVIALVRDDIRRIAHLVGEPNFSVAKCDVTDFNLTAKVIRERLPSVVIHLSGATPNSPLNSPQQLILNNTLGTASVLEAAASANVRCVIYSSSYSVYGKAPDVSPINESSPLHPGDAYGLTKMQGEELCKLYCDSGRFGAIVLRLSGVYGPRRRNGAVYSFVTNALNQTQSSLDSDVSWDIVYVKDVARACLTSMSIAAGYDVINVGGGRAVSIKALVEQVYREVGIAPRYTLRSAERPPSSFLDISKAKERLNYEPTPLSSALAECVAWSRAHDS